MRPRDRFEWILLGVLGLPFLVFAAVKPNVVESTVKSPGALARVAAITAGLIVLWWVLHRFVAPRTVRAAVFAVPVIALMAVMILPSFRDRTVDEELAVVAPSPAGTDTSDAPAESEAPDESPATTQPPIVQVATGMLMGIDHAAGGTVGLHERSDGSRVLFFEDDTDIEPGPDYDVYLVPGGDARSPDGGQLLGDLKGNQGSQNYEIPADVEVAGDHTVLIWCESFAVPVANAALQPV